MDRLTKPERWVLIVLLAGVAALAAWRYWSVSAQVGVSPAGDNSSNGGEVDSP